MAPTRSPGNPFAVRGAPAPAAAWHRVNGCRLYAEVRGSGPSLLIIGAASDDAEMFRPIAERLAGATATTMPPPSADSAAISGFTVATWDPRGTGRSSREGWPCDSRTHADDAAGLLRSLRLAPAAIFGASAGGIVAVRLALAHPKLVREVLVYEPGFLRSTDAGTALLDRATAAVDVHLRDHPDDWAGAVTAVSRMSARNPAADPDSSENERRSGPLDAPPGLEWYTDRGAALAENFIRDDLPRTRESLDPVALRASGAEIHFAFGTGSSPVFREIAETLTAARQRPGTPDPGLPDAIAGAAHLAYLSPGPIVDYIRARRLPEEPVD
jgi:pimeloyl-ACP methyl ester carboxylesterase